MKTLENGEIAQNEQISSFSTVFSMQSPSPNPLMDIFQ